MASGLHGFFIARQLYRVYDFPTLHLERHGGHTELATHFEMTRAPKKNSQMNHAFRMYKATEYSMSCSPVPCNANKSGNLLPGLEVWALCVGHKPAAEFTLHTERLSAGGGLP